LKELWWGCSRKNPPKSFPQTTQKGHGKDAKGRHPSVGGFRRDEDKNPPDSFPRTTRKGNGKDAKGRNPSVRGFRMDKAKDVQIRIRPNPFLGQPERVLERIQREETSQLGVSEGIRLRISR
jgi:hypothetical protein